MKPYAFALIAIALFGALAFAVDPLIITPIVPDNATALACGATSQLVEFTANSSMDEIGINCTLYVNSTPTEFNESVTNGTITVFDSDGYELDETYAWYIDCHDTVGGVQSEEREFYTETCPEPTPTPSPTPPPTSTGSISGVITAYLNLAGGMVNAIASNAGLIVSAAVILFLAGGIAMLLAGVGAALKLK